MRRHSQNHQNWRLFAASSAGSVRAFIRPKRKQLLAPVNGSRRGGDCISAMSGELL